ncbi:MAG: hypothetical protein A2X63_01685 [Ignavibacteria bacterium GWA2_35_8]|nr:MAG: hypothetical protein A2X63_01685 [Ignavibacteria bacterium GWA2_35_8]
MFNPEESTLNTAGLPRQTSRESGSALITGAVFTVNTAGKLVLAGVHFPDTSTEYWAASVA